MVSKVVIDLPFKGSWKYRRRERVLKVGSRREETITDLINPVVIFWRFSIYPFYIHPSC